MPYEAIDDKYLHLISLSPEDRRDLCNKMLAEMKEDVYRPKEVKYYVPGAHMYSFDGMRGMLAIRCPTVPVMYISCERAKGKNSKCYIRTKRHRSFVESYEFNFNIFTSYRTCKYLLYTFLYLSQRPLLPVQHGPLLIRRAYKKITDKKIDYYTVQTKKKIWAEILSNY